jgi:hypothetical protein
MRTTGTVQKICLTKIFLCSQKNVHFLFKMSFFKMLGWSPLFQDSWEKDGGRNQFPKKWKKRKEVDMRIPKIH